ncbi:MAG: hypothetical protein DME00_22525 [Candidatus Rokuibacteriota bacterium]|nr:MAG: hypothetical protein DME00_22525 [Candidatus Rokubacteria bacterium]
MCDGLADSEIAFIRLILVSLIDDAIAKLELHRRTRVVVDVQGAGFAGFGLASAMTIPAPLLREK